MSSLNLGCSSSERNVVDLSAVRYKAYIKGHDTPFAESGDDGVEFTLKDGETCNFLACIQNESTRQ